MRLSLSLIRLDGGTQMRARLDDDAIADLVEVVRAGKPFHDPVIVYYDGADHWLADGFHRVRASALAEVPDIDADVRAGDRRAAILYAVGANAGHGLRRSNEAKRRSVETLLRDSEWASWSDSEIARRAGVSHPFVARVRTDLGPLETVTSEVRTGADGRTINTANIGKRPAPAPAAAPPRHDPPAFLEGPGWVAEEDDDEPPVEVEPVKINPAPPPRRWGDDDMSALIANVATIAVDAEHALARISKLFDSADPSRRVEAIERCKNFVLNVANAALAQLPQSAVERRAAFAVIGGGKKTS